jgi:hypothetical protein
MEKEAILKRIDQLTTTNAHLPFEELAHATTTLLTLVYGKTSPQFVAFSKQMDTLLSKSGGHQTGRGYLSQIVTHLCQGTLRAMRIDIDLGLTGNLRQQITGEVLTDLIQLSRTILDEQGDKAKNVAAVLAAAAFEDTIRRMGTTLAGVLGKDDLSEVLKKLKDADVLKSPQVGIAQSYLSFRNHALHANWDNIQKESIHSVLGFVEQLLLKHFT